MEHQRRARIGSELLALCALQVGVEDKAVRIRTLQQDHPRVRHAVRVDRRQGHGVGIVGLALRGLLQPGVEQGERVGAFGHGLRSGLVALVVGLGG